LHHVLAEELGIAASVAELLEDYFRSHYPRHCFVSPDTLAALQKLRRRGLKLAIVTNGPTYWQSRKLEAMGILPFFDAVLISGSEGVEKPDSRIFMRALDRCGVQAAETIFVGDHPAADIHGALAAGLIPVWKRVPYWQVPGSVAQIDRISEVLALCGAAACSVREVQTDSEWSTTLNLLHSIFVDEGFSDPEAAKHLFMRERIQGSGELIAAIEPDGTVLGGAVLVSPQSALSQIARESEREFRLLGVSPQARDKGIGRRLVEECLQRARVDGARRMVLSTQPAMTAAHRLYEALGFVREEARDWRRGNGRLMWVHGRELF
jgi:HAD superfamily hydrolase (TIGR01509 family)